jgi:hypothetical protein
MLTFLQGLQGDLSVLSRFIAHSERRPRKGLWTGSFQKNLVNIIIFLELVGVWVISFLVSERGFPM